MPDQNIVATLMDEITIHGHDATEPEPRGWKVGDTAHHVAEFDRKHLYMRGADEPRICDNRNAGPLPKIRNAAHQAEMNGDAPAPEFHQSPRTVEVLHGPTMIDDYSRGCIRYGQAITGWPILKATIVEAPRNDAEREWLDTYLPCWITPDGAIIHGYEDGSDGLADE